MTLTAELIEEYQNAYKPTAGVMLLIKDMTVNEFWKAQLCAMLDIRRPQDYTFEQLVDRLRMSEKKGMFNYQRLLPS